MSQILQLPKAVTPRRPGQFEIEFEPETGTLYWWMKPQGRPCFTARFLADVETFERSIEERGGMIDIEGVGRRVWNYVVASRVPGVFNLGGDMSMFIQAILRKDVPALESYARLCVDNMYRRIAGFGSSITTFSLVQGRAFGGGFECALASNTILAERSALFCFPEILFNMIPGMGAISLLGRRIGLRKAEDIIMSGQTFTAKEMRELGAIDEVVDDGTGEQSLRRLLYDRSRRKNGYRAMAEASRCFMPVEISEMRRIVDVWVKAALRLETRDLRMMARLVRAQDKLMTIPEDDQAVDALFAPNLAVIGDG